MPRPLYILCSASGSEDKETGLVSVFAVVEQITLISVSLPPELHSILIPTPMVITAGWMRLPDDNPEEEYDFEIVFRFCHAKRADVPAPEDAVDVVASGRFRFSKPLHRINLRTSVQFVTPGTFTALARIRKTDNGDWISQDYPIGVVEVAADKDASPQSQPDRP